MSPFTGFPPTIIAEAVFEQACAQLRTSAVFYVPDSAPFIISAEDQPIPE